MGLFDKLKKREVKTVQRARMLTGPDEVPVYIANRAPIAHVKIGEKVCMEVMPCPTVIRTPDSAREQRKEEVCLSFNGIPCAFMRDATGTLMNEAKTSHVVLEVLCEPDHLGQPNPTFYAKWNKLSDAERAEREAYWRERDRTDALQFHLRVDFSDWQGCDLEDDVMFENAELRSDGESIVVVGDGIALFEAKPSMKYYEIAVERIGEPIKRMRARPKNHVKQPYIRVDFYY